jgi:hypothetical protein
MWRFWRLFPAENGIGDRVSNAPPAALDKFPLAGCLVI